VAGGAGGVVGRRAAAVVIASPAPVHALFGLPISALTMDQALELIDETISRRGRLQIGVVNAAKIVHMRQDAALRQDVLASDIVFADGMSVVWASRLLGRPLPERVAGIDLMLGMLRRGSERAYRIYCLGATEAVLSKATAAMATAYPGIKLVGQHHGYFAAEEEAGIAEEIAAAAPDILLVAMTSPRKEKFLARWQRQLGVPICHGVGGSFDVMAGKVRRAPDRWQRLGLEWLYRLKQEPLRLGRRYLVTNSVFCGMVLSELIVQTSRRMATMADWPRA
jgi:N-acetylglucosaminyldiphosphoundecaprenol N-acetyl-beta-D-mannosaminyltransferase